MAVDVGELDALEPFPETAKLSSGTMIVYESLRCRQFFKLLRILTRGAAPALSNPDLFNFSGEDAEGLGSKLLALVMLAIPEAEDETIVFVRSMVRPAGLIDRPASQLNKGDKERNEVLWAALDKDLDNPELDDLLTILEGVVRRESKDLAALAKRVSAMFKMAQKTGQLPASLNLLTSSEETSSAGSVEPLISSPASTDGPTTFYVTSPSEESANA